MPAGIKTAKGFIGPLGDDLPSLIPILVGLIIFFSSFTFAFNAFDKRNSDLASDRAVLEVARVLQSNGYIVGVEDFERLCASLNIAEVQYLAGITNAFTAPNGSRQINPFNLEFHKMPALDGSRQKLSCLAQGMDPDFELSQAFVKDKRLLLKVFPVVVEEDKIVKPMHLVVAAWK